MGSIGGLSLSLLLGSLVSNVEALSTMSPVNYLYLYLYLNNFYFLVSSTSTNAYSWIFC